MQKSAVASPDLVPCEQKIICETIALIFISHERASIGGDAHRPSNASALGR